MVAVAPVTAAVLLSAIPSVSSQNLHWALKHKHHIEGRYGSPPIKDAHALEASVPFLSGVPTQSQWTASYSTPAPLPTKGYPGHVYLGSEESNIDYFITAGFGPRNSEQYFNLVADSGSSDLWIVKDTCKASTSCPDAMPKYNQSMPSQSLVDLHKPFSVHYGSGTASGSLVMDSVSVGSLNVTNQTFALCDNLSDGLLESSTSGILGLAFGGLAASESVPLWQNWVLRGNGSFPGFAVAIKGVASKGGQINVGYLNNSVFEGPLTMVNLTWLHDVPENSSLLESPAFNSRMYWSIPMAGLVVNGSRITINGTDSMKNKTALLPTVGIDTGSTLIGGPQSVIEEVYRHISGSQRESGEFRGYYSYPCASDVDVALQFGDRNFSMPPEDFNLGKYQRKDGEDRCLGSFFDVNIANTDLDWIIGASFLRNVYSVFSLDPLAVGFANIRNSNLTYPVSETVVSATSATVLSPSATVTLNRTLTRTLGLSTHFYGGQTYISTLKSQPFPSLWTATNYHREHAATSIEAYVSSPTQISSHPAGPAPASPAPQPSAASPMAHAVSFTPFIVLFLSSVYLFV